MILLLNRYSTFRDKLTSKPLGNFFPEYDAGKGCAAAFIQQQFEARRPTGADRRGFQLFPFIVDTDARCCKMSDIISEAVQEILDGIRGNLSQEEVVEELLAEVGFPEYDTVTGSTARRLGDGSSMGVPMASNPGPLSRFPEHDTMKGVTVRRLVDGSSYGVPIASSSGPLRPQFEIRGNRMTLRPEINGLTQHHNTLDGIPDFLRR